MPPAPLPAPPTATAPDAPTRAAAIRTTAIRTDAAPHPPAGTGLLNRPLLAAAAVGLACAALMRPAADPIGIRVWGQDELTIGLGALLGLAGYRLAALGAAEPGTGLPTLALRLAARVLPGLLAATLLVAVAIGTLGTDLPLGAYWTNVHTRTFLENAVLRPHPFLPGVFGHAPRPTLAAPFTVAIRAAAAGALLVLALRRVRAATAATLLAAAALAAGIGGRHLAALPPGFLSGQAAASCSSLAFLFSGAALHRATNGDPRPFAFDLAMLCFVGNAVAAWFAGPACLPLLWLTLPLLAVAASGDLLPRAGAPTPDPTLGLLLTAFPLCQLFWSRGLSWPLALSAALLLGLLWGYSSWFALERPVLRRWSPPERAS